MLVGSTDIISVSLHSSKHRLCPYHASFRLTGRFAVTVQVRGVMLKSDRKTIVLLLAAIASLRAPNLRCSQKYCQQADLHASQVM